MGRFSKGRVVSRASALRGGASKITGSISARTRTRVGKQSKYGPLKGMRPRGIKTTGKGIGR